MTAPQVRHCTFASDMRVFLPCEPALSFALFHHQTNQITDRADGLRCGEITDAAVKMEPELLAERLLGQVCAVLQAALS